jgi:hypothetical protein
MSFPKGEMILSGSLSKCLSISLSEALRPSDAYWSIFSYFSGLSELMIALEGRLNGSAHLTDSDICSFRCLHLRTEIDG